MFVRHLPLLGVLIVTIFALGCSASPHMKLGPRLDHFLTRGDVNGVLPKHAILKRNDGMDEETTAIWIKFNAKCGAVSPAEGITAKAVARRLKHGHGITEEDRPVCVAYKVAVDNALKSLHFPATLRQESRWLNALSYSVAVSDVANAVEVLKTLDFVSELEVVGRMVRPNSDPSEDSSQTVQSVSVGGSAIGGQERAKSASSVSGRRDVQTVEGLASTSVDSIDLDYGDSLDQLSRIGIPPVHRMGYYGTGVVISVLDSGFNTQHESLRELTVVAEYDFVYNDTNVSDDTSERGASNHGTATWSNIGAKKDGVLYGGAFESRYILCKTEDVRTETSIEEDNFVRAIEFSEQNGADILSASLGYDNWLVWADFDGTRTTIAKAGNRAVDLGMLFVVANGNAGMKGIGTPADMDRILSVGALGASNEVLATFSSRGPTFDGRVKPEVSAPGVQVKVAQYNNVNGYTRMSGTSFATPLTAGVAALVLEAHPNWTNLQLRDAIIKTATPKGTPVPNVDFGFGVVNAINAVTYRQPITTAESRCIAPNGTWNQTSSTCVCAPNFFDTDCGTRRLRCSDYCQGVCSPTGECLCVSGVLGRCTKSDVMWTCARNQYNDGLTCNCNCGLYDPDCANPSLPIAGCATTNGTCIQLNTRGVCAPAPSSPETHAPIPTTPTPPTPTPAAPPQPEGPLPSAPSANIGQRHPGLVLLSYFFFTILNFIVR